MGAAKDERRHRQLAKARADVPPGKRAGHRPLVGPPHRFVDEAAPLLAHASELERLVLPAEEVAALEFLEHLVLAAHNGIAQLLHLRHPLFRARQRRAEKEAADRTRLRQGMLER